MGGSSWSDSAYADRASARVTNNLPTFDYHAKVESGQVAAKVHPTLDPHGLLFRESRDSSAHPETNSIFVALDVTGSMAAVVKDIHAKLPSLINLLTQNNYVTDPQILFAAVGDATSDKFPLQVGQFESGLEMEENVTNMILEGAGGGGGSESYELAAYIGARKTVMDCLEKRGKKGYFFFIGDELTYKKVNNTEVLRLIGETIEAIPTEQIFRELKDKYNVFFILPEDASGGHDPKVTDHWSKLVGVEHVLKLHKAAAIAELIAIQVGLCEGTTTLNEALEHMKSHGVDSSSIAVVRSAVSTSASNINIPASVRGHVDPTSAAPGITRI